MAAAGATEVEAFLALARERLTPEGWRASDWGETGLRTALLHEGRRRLENLLNDPALPLPGDARRPGEKGTAGVEREIETLFGPLTVRRNYYHAAATGEGRYPLDAALKLAGPCTPALARLMSRAGAQTGFAAGSEDRRVYGGLAIQGRQIHRLMQNASGPPSTGRRKPRRTKLPRRPCPCSMSRWTARARRWCRRRWRAEKANSRMAPPRPAQ